MNKQRYPKYNSRMGDLGENVFFRLSGQSNALANWEVHPQNRGQTGQGPDFLLTEKASTGKRVAVEVKTWKETGQQRAIGEPMFTDQVTRRFDSIEGLGYQKVLFVLGNEPINWQQIAEWCRGENIKPAFLPIGKRELEVVADFARHASSEVFREYQESFVEQQSGKLQQLFDDLFTDVLAMKEDIAGVFPILQSGPHVSSLKVME